MQLRIMSDLHLESHRNYRPSVQPNESDTILILAGDICEIRLNDTISQFLSDMAVRFKRVIYVPGNHEYYNGHITKSKDDLAYIISNIDNVILLVDNSVVIEGVKFIGSTLWTDVNKGNPIDQFAIMNGLNDYRKIRIHSYRRLQPHDTIALHGNSKNFIESELSNSKERKNVVITHHAPSKLSINERFNGSPLNSAYYSDLQDIIFDKSPDIWIHGHTHDSFDYELGKTRILCNPRGYSYVRSNVFACENRNFCDNLILTI